MNFKKLMVIGIMLIVGLTFIGAVSSAGFLEMMDLTPYESDTVITADEFNFTIPEGYGEDTDEITDETNDYGITIIQHNYFNDDGDLVGVTVIYNGSDITVNDFDTTNHTEATLGDKEGMYEYDEDTESVDFFYIENNKYIDLTAPNNETIELMILGNK